MRFLVLDFMLLLLLAILPSFAQNVNELAAIADKDIWWLDPPAFRERILGAAEGTWLVFYATRWCPYCKKLNPKWLRVQKTVESEQLYNQMFSMAKVDCTDVGEFCSEIKVKGYPNIYLYHNGEYVDQYLGQHEYEDILIYIREKISLYHDSAPVQKAAADPSNFGNVKLNNQQDESLDEEKPIILPLENKAFKKDKAVQGAVRASTSTTALNVIPVGPMKVVEPKIAAAPPQKVESKIIVETIVHPQVAAPQIASPSSKKVAADEEEFSLDEPDEKRAKGVKKHPRKEFPGFRGFIQSTLLTPLVGPECSTSIISFQLYSHFDCTRLLISKVLGFGLVAGGAVIKLPQIFKIFMKRSALGVSFSSYALETAAYIAGLAYNVRRDNPFNTYGEHAFMAVANYIVIAMMFHYSGQYSKLQTVTILTLVFTVSLFSKSIINDTILLSLQWVAILVGIVSKLPQIHSNWNNQSCGQLSAVTVGLQTVGSLARCFTTATEVKDLVIFVTYLVATALNGTVLYQVYIYWGKSRKSKSLMD